MKNAEEIIISGTIAKDIRQENMVEATKWETWIIRLSGKCSGRMENMVKEIRQDNMAKETKWKDSGTDDSGRRVKK